ncbi:MAG: hypothetical protein GF364_01915 [Candidatus Lokiarchaeota archaeon]|nr:hypothetical protein [Candidatus Lokiarchaeota archaeon]
MTEDGEDSNPNNSFEMIPFSKMRQVVVDVLYHAKRRHTVWGLFEVDVTETRKILAEYKKKHEKSITLTAWMIFVISHALGKYPRMQAIRKGRNKLIIFDDVDINLIVERTIKNKKIPTSYVLRAANRKSLAEINEELYEVKNVKGDNMALETKKSSAGKLNTIANLPGFIRRLIFGYILRRPKLKKKFYGTVGITSVGMFGQGTHGGWPVQITPHNISFALGALGRKPGIIGDKIAIREYLCITVAVDHDLIDGGPGTRFLKKLHTMLESSYGLNELN